MVKGLESASWPGRCQVAIDKQHNDLTWYLDGAHTADSLICCGQWFSEAMKNSPNRYDRRAQIRKHMPDVLYSRKALIFNCTADRVGKDLLKDLCSVIDPSQMSQVVFCPNVTWADGQYKGG